MHPSRLARFQCQAPGQLHRDRGVAPDERRQSRRTGSRGALRCGVRRLECGSQGEGGVSGAQWGRSGRGPWGHPRGRGRHGGRSGARLHEPPGVDGLGRPAPGHPRGPARDSPARPPPGPRRNHAPLRGGQARGAAAGHRQGAGRRFSESGVPRKRPDASSGRAGRWGEPGGWRGGGDPAARLLRRQHPHLDQRGPPRASRRAAGVSHLERRRREPSADTRLGRGVAARRTRSGGSADPLQPGREP